MNDWNNLDQMGRAEKTGYDAGKRDEQERILEVLDKKLGHVDFDDLIKIIKEDPNEDNQKKFRWS